MKINLVKKIESVQNIILSTHSTLILYKTSQNACGNSKPWSQQPYWALEQKYIYKRVSLVDLIIGRCSTFRSSSENPSWNSSPPWDRHTNSLWGCSKVRNQGQSSSPADPANRWASSSSPGGCSADSGSARKRSPSSWTPSWWVSRSRMRRRRRKRSPVASSCWDPWGCRASATPVRSRGPEKNRLEDEW